MGWCVVLEVVELIQNMIYSGFLDKNEQDTVIKPDRTIRFLTIWPGYWLDQQTNQTFYYFILIKRNFSDSSLESNLKNMVSFAWRLHCEPNLQGIYDLHVAKQLQCLQFIRDKKAGKEAMEYKYKKRKQMDA